MFHSATVRFRRVSTAGLATVLAALLAFAGCSGATSSNGGSSDGGTSEGGTSSLKSTSPSTCPNGCPDGQYCLNGACVIGCNSDKDCADDQYCATDTTRLCHNKDVPTCTRDEDCEQNQVCTHGLCSAEPETESNDECQPSPDGKDGCGKYAVCVERQSGNKCYTLPPCGADGTCPTGQAGAVCNEGYIPNKAEICLVGLCKGDEHCPSNWSCSKGTSSQTLGFCTATGGGQIGSMCQKDSDCNSGNCKKPSGSTHGICE